MIGVGLIARWRERRRVLRALPGVVEDLRARVAELERWRVPAAKTIIRQHEGLLVHKRELIAIARTLEGTPTLRGRLESNRRRVIEEAVAAAVAAERAAASAAPTPTAETTGDATAPANALRLVQQEETAARG